jgi:cytochrome d ubiquinol oxidase subunit II
MGPVWESNHVWLIFVIVLLFTGFPSAFAALSVALFIPFHLVLVGITLRGAAFVFRGPQVVSPSIWPWGAVFGFASVITPLLLGMCVGAVSAGNIHIQDGNVVIPGLPPWLALESLTIGALTLALCAYLAAVYLIHETTGELQEDFRKRALYAGTAVVVLAALMLPVLFFRAPHLWRGLLQPYALPVFLLGIFFALLSGWTLRQRHYSLARLSAIAQIVFLLLGWGLAQYPYLIYPDVTLQQAAAPPATLQFVIVAVPLGCLVLLPSLWFLFRVFKGETVPVQK